jgi:hypothetical protein
MTTTTFKTIKKNLADAVRAAIGIDRYPNLFRLLDAVASVYLEHVSRMPVSEQERLDGTKALRLLYRPHRCPFCGEVDSTTANDYEGAGRELTCRVTCEICKHNWIEVYTMAWVSDFDKG